jgi:hypothetical protein
MTTIETTDTLNAGRVKINDNFTDVLSYVKTGNFVIVNSLSDLPTASIGVITLISGTTYLFTEQVDLLGSRLVCGIDTVIVGWS